MQSILEIKLVNSELQCHADLYFRLADLKEEYFDTYYFELGIEQLNSIDLVSAIRLLLDYWIDKVTNIESEGVIYLPIDFSDQYTGCLQIKEKDENLFIRYGISGREGYAVNPINPGDYYKSISDFEPNVEKQLQISKPMFLKELEIQKNSLLTNGKV